MEVPVLATPVVAGCPVVAPTHPLQAAQAAVLARPRVGAVLPYRVAAAARLRPPLYGQPMQFGGYEGPNSDLYAQQFGNLVGGNNAFQSAQLANAIRREQQQNAPQEQWSPDWSWANLPEVRTNQGGAGDAWTWQLRPGITRNSTNEQVVAALSGSGVLSADDLARMREHFAGSPHNAAETDWVNAGSPEALFAGIQTEMHPSFRGTIDKIFNNIYQRSDLTTPAGGGPAAPPPGYAAPR